MKKLFIDLAILSLFVVFATLAYGAGHIAGTSHMDRTELIAQMAAELGDKVNQLDKRTGQLERADIFLSVLFPGWDRAEPLFSKKVDVSVYTSRPEETDNTPYVTACNTPVQVGGVAVSRDLFEELGGCGQPLALSNSLGAFFINDKMNKRYEGTIDIWSGDLEAARLFGRQTALMFWQ